VQAGIDDGTIRSDIEPMTAAMTLYGMATGLLQIISMKSQVVLEFHNLKAEELIETLFNLISASLRPQGDGP
jgi:hypothetical protein